MSGATGMQVGVAVAGWRGVLTEPAGQMVWACPHSHPTVTEARQCATRECATPGRGALGWRLRQLRHAAGLSQGQVAEALEWSTSKVSRIEHDRSLPTPRDVRDLTDLYQANPSQRDELLTAARHARAAGSTRHRRRPHDADEDGAR